MDGAQRTTFSTYLVLLVVVGAPAVMLLTPYGASIACGLVLSVLFQPLHARLHRKVGSAMAALLVTGAAVLLVVVPIPLIVLGGVRQASASLAALPAVTASPALRLADTIRAWVPLTRQLGNPDEVSAMIVSAIGEAAGALRDVLLTGANQAPDLVVQLVLVVLSTYFLLVDGERLFLWCSSKIPLSPDLLDSLVGSFRDATRAVVMASIASTGAQALCVLVAFTVLGVPAAFLAAGAAFVLAWIPTLGTVPLWGTAAVWLYFQDSPGRAAAMVAAGLVIGLVDNVVRPLVLNGQKTMHPLVSLVAILGGISMYGVAGAFLGPLIASLAISALDLWPTVAERVGISMVPRG